MFIVDLVVLVLAFYLLLKAVDYAINYATQLATLFSVSAFVVSFFVIGIVSAAPESTIAFLSHLADDANTAASSLLASNVADIALVFGIMALLTRGLPVKSDALKKDSAYLAILTLPFIFMYDGTLSRLEGALLLFAGLLFFWLLAKQSNLLQAKWPKGKGTKVCKVFALLLISLAAMLGAAHFAVKHAQAAALHLHIPTFVVSVVIVGIGVCLPELIFAIKSMRQHNAGLGAGNVLSVVMIDGTIMLGLLAIIKPLVIRADLFRVTNVFMALSALLLIYLLKTAKKLGWREGVVMLCVYAGYLYLSIGRLAFS